MGSRSVGRRPVVGSWSILQGQKMGSRSVGRRTVGFMIDHRNDPDRQQVIMERNIVDPFFLTIDRIISLSTDHMDISFALGKRTPLSSKTTTIR